VAAEAEGDLCLTASVATSRLERSFSPSLGFKATTAVPLRHGFQGPYLPLPMGIFSASHVNIALSIKQEMGSDRLLG
jgi:hypothetical protein